MTQYKPANKGWDVTLQNRLQVRSQTHSSAFLSVQLLETLANTASMKGFGETASRPGSTGGSCKEVSAPAYLNLPGFFLLLELKDWII